jgi:hypothetical protein
MPCGWNCGAYLTATEIRQHFTDCPKRPSVSKRMTVKVKIHRQQRPEPAHGALRAYALAENNKPGRNLLPPKITEIETAKGRVRAVITAELAKMHLPAPEFEWTIEDWKNPPAVPQHPGHT